MSGARIVVEDVAKRYVRYVDAPLLVGSLLQLRNRSRRERLEALRGLDFTVDDGEFVGVIGRNGSGKSTLLRLLAGVTAPSTGRVSVRGRVAPLIAVGVGFHPELTGRENVFVNGAILGQPRREIADRLDEIVDFSEIGEFLDTPVKFYSSGMFVRLGFAASVLADPDVLLVDEVLAVGDVAFQGKCFRRMQELRERGTTVIVVSHNLASVRRLCDRTIVLHDGDLIHDGPTSEAISLYHDILLDEAETETGGRRAELVEFDLLDDDGAPVRRVEVDATCTARMVVRADAPVRGVVLNLSVADEGGSRVFSENTDPDGLVLPAGETTLEVRFVASLVEGSYDVTMVTGDQAGRAVAGVGGPVSLYVEGRPRVKGVADLHARFRMGADELGN